MKHRFKYTCYDATKLLEGCTSLREFNKRAIKQSEEHPEKWPPMTYRGEAFEALVEVLILCSPIDKRLNITNYRPWSVKLDGDDMGVDGVGVSHDSSIPHLVQCKFRENEITELTANKDHISNFVAKSLSMHPGQKVNMTIFTTAKGLLDPVNQGMYHGQVRTHGFKEISKLIDNNGSFWAIFRNEMGI